MVGSGVHLSLLSQICCRTSLTRVPGICKNRIWPIISRLDAFGDTDTPGFPAQCATAESDSTPTPIQTVLRAVAPTRSRANPHFCENETTDLKQNKQINRKPLSAKSHQKPALSPLSRPLVASETHLSNMSDPHHLTPFLHTSHRFDIRAQSRYCQGLPCCPVFSSNPGIFADFAVPNFRV
jgi:hypothetical protein